MNKIKCCFSILLALSFGLISPFHLASQDFNQDFQKILDTYVVDGLVNYANPQLEEDLDVLFENNIEEIFLPESKNRTKALLINVYNAAVIRQVVKNYPITSPQEVNDFFTEDVIPYMGLNYNLNRFERELLLDQYNDPRLHFALVCAAVSCPKLSSQAYTEDRLEQGLDSITNAALKDDRIIKIGERSVALSNIFRWYSQDFGDVRQYLSQYDILVEDKQIKYLPYDWSLNDQTKKQGNNSFRYISSSTVRKGGFELKIFNNLYSQVDPNERSNFFTQTTSFVYGVRPNFNIGFDLRYRRVNYLATDSSPFEVLGALSTGGHRVSNLGPKIRWAPNPKRFPNFSIQSAFWFSTSSQSEELANGRFLDWSNATWITQFFNDFTFGDKYSLFTELDFIWEDIGGADQFNRFSTPATLIFSYFPIKNWTIYGLGQYSPFIQNPYDYFYQYGIGTKYQFTPDLELEISYTSFSNEYLKSVDGTAATYNIGIRYSKN